MIDFYFIRSLHSESEQSLVWPDLAFYTMPFVKNHTAYQKFMDRVQSKEFENEQEYDSNAREALYSDPKDFFLALNMAKDYQTAVQNLSRIPIEPPYVRVVLNDYMYNGYIGVISLEAIKQFLIKEGNIESGMKDFDFDLIVSLNVSFLFHHNISLENVHTFNSPGYREGC